MWLFEGASSHTAGPAGAATLEALSDVDSSMGEARGDILYYGASPSQWTNLQLGSDGDVLKSDGTDISWGPLSSIGHLSDVNDPTFNKSDLLYWDANNNYWDTLSVGSEGEVLKIASNSTLTWSEGGGGSLQDLSDVNSFSETHGDILYWDNNNNKSKIISKW